MKHGSESFELSARSADMAIRDRIGVADDAVTCIACGTEVLRSDAREYDKHGDRWDRNDKRFEYLCKPCDGDRCHRPREGLEETLVSAGAGATDRRTFLRRYYDLVDGSSAGWAEES
jgi:hypothetical protein